MVVVVDNSPFVGGDELGGARREAFGSPMTQRCRRRCARPALQNLRLEEEAPVTVIAS
jgi:hypothetical protein